MKKFKLFFNFEKEEKWLESMTAQGWLLSGKYFFYNFQKVVPQKETIRIDFRDPKSASDFMDYCTLFEDSGWRHIAGTKSSGTQYFLKMNDAINDEIFSDTLSRAARYKRIANMWLICGIICIPWVLSSKTGGWINFETMFSPKAWYLTPGLWESDGTSFLLPFLFETPFALMRGIGWLLPVTVILIYFSFTIKSILLYRSAKQSEA